MSVPSAARHHFCEALAAWIRIPNPHGLNVQRPSSCGDHAEATGRPAPRLTQPVPPEDSRQTSPPRPCSSESMTYARASTRDRMQLGVAFHVKHATQAEDEGAVPPSHGNPIAPTSHRTNHRRWIHRPGAATQLHPPAIYALCTPVPAVPVPHRSRSRENMFHVKHASQEEGESPPITLPRPAHSPQSVDL